MNKYTHALIEDLASLALRVTLLEQKLQDRTKIPELTSAGKFKLKENNK